MAKSEGIQLDPAIEKAVAELNKSYGEGTILRLGEKVGKPLPSIPTGIYGVDYGACGIGGFPQGRITELAGPQSGGKTTLAFRAMASAQRLGLQAAFVDAEYSFDPNWADRNGVDVDRLLVAQPNTGEEALKIVEKLIYTEKAGIIVVDSVAALVPQAELNGEIGDSNVGLLARLMAQFTRMAVGALSRTNTTLIFINQIREKIGVMFGSPETTPGGRSLPHFASMRLDVRKIGTIKENEIVIGNKVRVKNQKNKSGGMPFQETEVDLFYATGFDDAGSLFDAAVEANVIQKSGAWYSFNEQRLGQGRDAAKAAMDSATILKALKGFHGHE